MYRSLLTWSQHLIAVGDITLLNKSLFSENKRYQHFPRLFFFAFNISIKVVTVQRQVLHASVLFLIASRTYSSLALSCQSLLQIWEAQSSSSVLQRCRFQTLCTKRLLPREIDKRSCLTPNKIVLEIVNIGRLPQAPIYHCFRHHPANRAIYGEPCNMEQERIQPRPYGRQVQDFHSTHLQPGKQ